MQEVIKHASHDVIVRSVRMREQLRSELRSHRSNSGGTPGDHKEKGEGEQDARGMSSCIVLR